MCTVTYIPQKGNDFILTSNRDETASRSPQNITRAKQGDLQLIYPQDTAAGGTWIAAANDGRVGCVLNGAFEKHKHQPPYKRSRGLMVLDYFLTGGASDFYEKYDFTGMEPFTFIMIDHRGVYELRWDEQQAHFIPKDRKRRYIWSSSTLYPQVIRKQREEWFRSWQEGRTDYSLKEIQEFHRHGGESDPWNGFVMNRNDLVQTVSITNVVKKNDRMSLIYCDLLRNRVRKEFLNGIVEKAAV